MAAPNQIKRLSMELFNESDDIVIPRLIHELKVPHRVAAVFPVAPNAIRRWLVVRGWTNDGEKWVEPKQEPTHA